MASNSFSRSGASASSSSSASRGRNSKKPTKRNSPFADFGSYMAEKNRKLRHQFDSEASASSLGGGDDGVGIFHGVSIFVDGFTAPSSQELRAIMLKHGGRMENYFSRQRVTHIICSHLPDSKMKNFRAFSRGLPVVKPAWLVDSVAANKLLSWVPYQIKELMDEVGKQQKLLSFFTHKTTSTFKHAEPHVDPNTGLYPEGLLFADEEPKPLLLSGDGEFPQGSRHCTEEPTCPGEEKIFEEVIEEIKSADLEDEHSAIEAFDSSPRRCLSDSKCIDNNTMKETLDVKFSRACHQRHSISQDPNFVENYFKNSRLHFIGTWRNRYWKRFGNMLSGAKSSNANCKSVSATNNAAIIHIDMDCFFVSVIVRNYPELLDKPVAVCHSDNPRGTAEISSANYPARDYGISAGMFVRDAKARCPQLVIFPYDFEAYEEVADQFYSILHKHCNKVQALSCDEAYLDVTECGGNDPEQLALMIRKEIAETTRCTASAGIAGNLLLARLATKSAKPNGQHFIPYEKVDNYLKDLPVKALPGIGYALKEKLKSRQIQTCGELRMIPKEVLHKDFGTRIGDMLWSYCRGIDSRSVEVVQETKSVGAEVNWGVRFRDITDCHHFLMALCKEVSLRLQGCGVQGRTVTLKVKKRRKGAEEPMKFMGCGDCESMSRAMTLPIATDNIAVLQRISKQIFSSFHIDVKEVRGVGLQISRLENVDMSRQGHEGNTLESWLASASESIKEQAKEATNAISREDIRVTEVLLPNAEPQPSCKDCGSQKDDGNSAPCCVIEARSSGSSHMSLCGVAAQETGNSTLPPLCHLDVEVIKNLPPEIISEMNEMYNGKLCDLIEKHQTKDGQVNSYLSTMSPQRISETIPSTGYKKVSRETDVGMHSGQTDSEIPDLGAKSSLRQPLSSPAVFICELPTARKALGSTTHYHQSSSFTCSRSNGLHIDTAVGADRIDLMPASLSQADVSVLQQLPEDLKADVINLLPPHRGLNDSGNAPNITKCPYDLGAQNSRISKMDLWAGKPPNWVEKFKNSSCLILNIIAELYYKSGANSLLSSVLQALIPFLPLSCDSSDEEWDEAFLNLCELLMQYIDLKIESDIEELYICFRHLKRFSLMSKFLLELYNKVLPSLQTSVSEIYGGKLQLPMATE